ncbi:MAG: Glu-tRNA(Gln) amidotransferase subunit GatE [bacterium]|nr:Glu-tRNA(Gln) amidotransferase subunit GatE [bacterium]
MAKLPMYGTLAARDYANIGFKSGLEIHQQLLTKKKLFCNCPAGLYTNEYDAEILRHMRPTLSELGEYDGTALMEFKTKKEILYRLHGESVCTYEMDDAPPFHLNDEALEGAMVITQMLGLQAVGEIHIARKQYLDGSIPTGFQRTTILGVQGSIPVGKRQVSILQLGLEEDSCREISDEGHFRTYKTDRLGMPLIEMVTGPELRTPAEVEKAAQALRELARSSGRVRTGIGAGRQDVNVSVTGGTRVEIKGVSRIPTIGKLTHIEAFRQKRLLEIRDVLLNERQIKAVGYQCPRLEVTELLDGTEYRPIEKAREQGLIVGAIQLPGFGDVLFNEIQPGVAFLSEFKGRVRVIACLDKKPNLVCSEQMTTGPRNMEWERIRQLLGAPESDPIILVWGSREDVETAFNEIELRAQDALAGVPGETRQARYDGTTRFERILPGPDRMYPDTDLPPLPLTAERWQMIRDNLPLTPWELRAELGKFGLPAEMIKQLVHMRRANAFLSLNPDPDICIRLAEILTSHWRYLQRAGFNMPSPEELDWLPAFLAENPRELDLSILRSWSVAGGGGRPLFQTCLRGEQLASGITYALPDIEEPATGDTRARIRYFAGRIKDKLNRAVAGRELISRLDELPATDQGGE